MILRAQPSDDGLTKGEEASTHRTATAIRIKGAPPKLDGILDDNVWDTAPLHENFMQSEPEEGAPPTERTTFQIAYNDEALYIAVMCYDTGLNRPEATTILGAAKIVGRTHGNTSFGIMEAITAPE